jgi:hypothetical protein
MLLSALSAESVPSDRLGSAFVVEFSRTHRLFSVQSVRRMIELNRAAFASDSRCDWVPLGIFMTREEAEAFIHEFDPEGAFASSTDIKALGARLARTEQSEATADWLRNRSVGNPNL